MNKNRKMKKLFIVITIVVALCIAAVITALYAYNNPVVAISVGKPVNGNADIYIEDATVGYSGRFGIEPSQSFKDKSNDFCTKVNAVVTDLRTSASAPTHITVSVTVIDGKTKVVFSGILTNENGTDKNYSKEIIFDYILSKNVE